MLTHLLDTTAWIAHLFQEEGTEQVIAFFDDPTSQIGICALSLVELHGRLKLLNLEAEYEQIIEAYQPLFAEVIPVDEAVARQAVAIRKASAARVPAMDVMIAAAASLNAAILIHRDKHFQSIPTTIVRQFMLHTVNRSG